MSSAWDDLTEKPDNRQPSASPLQRYVVWPYAYTRMAVRGEDGKMLGVISVEELLCEVPTPWIQRSVRLGAEKGATMVDPRYSGNAIQSKLKEGFDYLGGQGGFPDEDPK